MLLSFYFAVTCFIGSLVVCPEVWLAWIQNTRAWLAERDEQRLTKLRIEFYDYTQSLANELEAFGWERARIDRLVTQLRDEYEKEPC